MKKIINFLLLLFFIGKAFAQSPTTKYIDFNNISARIENNCTFFNMNSMNLAGYSVPKNSQKTTIYNFNVWMGALDVNNVPQIINKYYSNTSTTGAGNYTPGPWSSTQQYQENDYLFKYFYSLWEVSKSEIDFHIANYMNPGYVMPSSIAEWPGNGDVSLGVSQQLAPFVDLNGNEIYEPDLGEYPDIPGGKAVYLITTDRDTYPNAGLGLEMHFMFYQYNSNLTLANTTFLMIKVINKSTMNYHDFKISFYLDTDIGGPSDDMIGCDTLLNMAYAYNGDGFDENSQGVVLGYGSNPPAQGVMSLSHKMSSLIVYRDNGAYPYSDPVTFQEFWNSMNGLWRNGSSIGYGNNSFSVDSIHPPTTYIYPGNPVTGQGWSEFNSDIVTNPGGEINMPGDRRILMTIDLGDLNVNDEKCADFAFVTSFLGGSFLSNVSSLKSASTYIQQLYNADETFPCRRFYLNTEDLNMQDFNVYPNPTQGSFTINLNEFVNNSTVQVTTLTGQIVYNEIMNGISHTINLEKERGVYLVTIINEKGRGTKRVIIE